MMENINIRFIGNIVNEDGKMTIDIAVCNMLRTLAYRRTYFDNIVNDTPYADAYETTDARQYFQACLVCCEKGLWPEAFAWYKRGALYFTGTAVISAPDSDVQCDFDVQTGQWEISVETWFNTMYGSKKELHTVGSFRDELEPMATQDMLDRLAELRGVWVDMVDIAKRLRIRNEQALQEFAASFNWNKE